MQFKLYRFHDCLTRATTQYWVGMYSCRRAGTQFWVQLQNIITLSQLKNG